jgi:hypothetical protein
VSFRKIQRSVPATDGSRCKLRTAMRVVDVATNCTFPKFFDEGSQHERGARVDAKGRSDGRGATAPVAASPWTKASQREPQSR